MVGIHNIFVRHPVSQNCDEERLKRSITFIDVQGNATIKEFNAAFKQTFRCMEKCQSSRVWLMIDKCDCNVERVVEKFVLAARRNQTHQMILTPEGPDIVRLSFNLLEQMQTSFFFEGIQQLIFYY